MGIIDLKTNLKSLKWGKDRPGGGSSNQPYIKRDIPEGDLPSFSGNVIERSALDTSRITQFLFDTKSAKGLQFIAEQNLLSRIGVQTESSLLNGGIYSPTTTLAQTPVTGLGIHLNGAGIDPSGLTLIKYEQFVKTRNQFDSFFSNRLVGLYTKHMDLDNTSLSGIFQGLGVLSSGQSLLPTNILSYQGGPGSKLGIGKTTLKFADNSRTGRQNPKLRKALKFFDGVKFGVDDYSVFRRPDVTYNKDKIFTIGGDRPSVSLLYRKLTGVDPNRGQINLLPGNQGFYNFATSVYTPFSAGTFPKMSGRQNDNGTQTLSQIQLIGKETTHQTGISQEDFRKEIIDTELIKTSTVLSISPSYKTKNIETRVNLGDPGKKKDIYNYGLPATDLESLDKITSLLVYEAESNKLTTEAPVNDLVKFRIAILNNESDLKTYVHFRAFVDSFSDSYEQSLGSTKYVGRGEEFYNSQGFSRQIQMSFKIVAQSKAELIPMYSKLNYLASTLAPDYSTSGFARGNIHKLTLGGYLYEQPGFITSLNYDINEQSPWEIGIDEKGEFDSSVKELPLYIDVNLSFQPIHTFVPQKDTNYQSNPTSKFISLTTTGDDGNYKDIDKYNGEEENIS